MKVGDFKNVFTKNEFEVIHDNLRAYLANVDYLCIEKANIRIGGYHVFTTEERREEGAWTQYCYNIDYLNGWLYGCVQAMNGIVKKKVEEEI